MHRKSVQDDKGYFANLLRQAGYKATAGRIGLLKLLKNSGKPLSIQELAKKLSEVKIDQATIYRVLTVLEEIGVVRQVNLLHGHADYEFVREDDHHHLICTKCRRVEDVAGCDDGVTRQVLRRSTNFAAITQHSFEFFGICKSCARK